MYITLRTPYCPLQLTCFVACIILGIRPQGGSAHTEASVQSSLPATPVTGESIFLQHIPSVYSASKVEGHWIPDIEGRRGYALQEAENPRQRKQLINSPHLLKWNMTFLFIGDSLFVGIEAHYLSSRLRLDGKPTGAYCGTDVTLFNHNLINGVEITGAAFNLFNTHSADPGNTAHRQNVITQDGRTFWLKLKYSF